MPSTWRDTTCALPVSKVTRPRGKPRASSGGSNITRMAGALRSDSACCTASGDAKYAPSATPGASTVLRVKRCPSVATMSSLPPRAINATASSVYRDFSLDTARIALARSLPWVSITDPDLPSGTGTVGNRSGSTRAGTHSLPTRRYMPSGSLVRVRTAVSRSVEVITPFSTRTFCKIGMVRCWRMTRACIESVGVFPGCAGSVKPPDSTEALSIGGGAGAG